MRRGLQNSSLTRVRPFFRALSAMDPDGESWLPRLLAACPFAERLPASVRATPGRLLPGTTTPRPYLDKILGHITLESCFERPVAPPASFLAFLLTHPAALRWPTGGGEPKVFGPETQRRRQALVDGPEEARGAAIQEGLEALRRQGAARSKAKWWAFEGFTEVDCCLETERLVLFVEGKRNELLSESTQWFRGRNQLVRNLEVLGELAGGRACAMLVASERPFTDPPPDAYEAGLPHLDPTERERVRGRYLGQVTWRSLCDATGVRFASLPHER